MDLFVNYIKSYVKLLFTTFIISYSSGVNCQDLMDLLEVNEPQKKEFVSGTFKATRLVASQSVESVGKKQWLFIVSHRFEDADLGLYNMFGLDGSHIRFGGEYGVTNRLNIGIGRTNYEKLYDGFIKYAILKQSKGPKSFPASVSYFASMAIKTEKWSNQSIDYETVHRFYYVHQLLIARKFSPNISLQIMPSFVHRNLVRYKTDQNNVFSVGTGGRYKFTKHLAFNFEYHYVLPGETDNENTHPLMIGFDIETGGHVFQIIASNSRGIHEKNIIAETNGKWTAPDIYLGFNITRYFSNKNKKTRNIQ